MNYETLKTKQRAIREGFSDNLGLRVHRALSWLNKAEQCEDDLDSKYIFLWIAFNAAYAQDMDESIRMTEAAHFSQFINKLVELDSDNSLYQMLWSEYASNVHILLKNQYVFQPFWEHKSGKLTEAEWKEKFQSANRAAAQALGEQDTAKLLSIVLQRLYTLRSQLIHGGATWQSSANREQIRDGSAFLSSLVPAIIDIMMDNPNTLWGQASYPVV
ncbi:HEPN domain-containing protein [Pseudidiomarina insulisalsae]|uniref:Uncharacterized protein n=1 Tax=Pseudidiomarina insulisalsae TaxID=575789 RepID=A0A432YQI4_9GAMM|nr:HEPN domain-containing protein [Pseudidiomarina insulisalsae]RUO63671.1 hypothetical protein CWI71_00990 [Pseudidiomarina insulisalsae]